MNISTVRSLAGIHKVQYFLFVSSAIFVVLTGFIDLVMKIKISNTDYLYISAFVGAGSVFFYFKGANNKELQKKLLQERMDAMRNNTDGFLGDLEDIKKDAEQLKERASKIQEFIDSNF